MRIDNTEIKEGGLTIVAGRPAMGKSVVCQSMIEDLLHSHKEDGEIALFILDYTNYYGYSYYASGKHKAKKSQWMIFAGQHPTVNLIHDDGMSFGQFRTILDYLREHTPVKYVFVDSVRILSERSYFQNEYVFDQTEIARFLVKTAEQYNVSIIAEFNADRKLEERSDKHPCVRDLNINEDVLPGVSSIVLIYRDWYYNRMDLPPEQKNKMDIEVIQFGQKKFEWDSNYIEPDLDG